MMKLQKLAAATILSVAMTTGAMAGAKLSTISGSVMVNKGTGFIPASDNIPLKNGDRLMVGPKSSASLVYTDGCKIRLLPGNVATISGASPCTFKADDNTVGPEPIIFGALAAAALSFVIYDGLKDDSSP